MNNIVEKWVNEWAIHDKDNKFREINSQILFYSKELFHDYQPIQGDAISFRARLENWLKNVPNETDRKTLFKIFPHLFYIGSKEFTALFRVAYNELIATWIIDIDNILFDDLDNAKNELEIGIKSCWICPVTDSFNINAFFHINNIPSTDWNEWRPQWYTIELKNDLWLTYSQHIDNYNIKKIILLEDFVGSGSQIEAGIRFLLDKHLDIDILLLPLINCPVGTERFKKLSIAYNRLTYKCVMEVTSGCFINKVPQPKEHSEFNLIRDVIKRNYNNTSGGIAEGSDKPYSPFGFRDTGGLIVMYTNTPDNTIPSIHWKSKSWEPIFPRHSRN